MAGSRFTLDDFLSLRSPASRVPLHVSPDGALLAMTIQVASHPAPIGQVTSRFSLEGVPVEAIGCRVILIDTKTGDVSEPFCDSTTSWAAQWSPDGERLAAYVQVGNDPCLGVWQRESGQVILHEEATVRPFFGFEIPRWSSDSRAVIVKLRPSTKHVEQGKADSEAPQVRVYRFDPDDAVAAQQPPGWSETFRSDLGWVDVSSRAVRRLVTNWRLIGWRVAPDASAVAVLRQLQDDPTRQAVFCDLVILRPNGAEPQVVATGIQQEYEFNFNWSPDCRSIAFTTQIRGEPARLFVALVDGSGPPHGLAEISEPGLAVEYEAPRWSHEGNAIYCLTANGCLRVANDGSSSVEARVPEGHEVLGWVQRPSGHTLSLPPNQDWPLLITRDPATLDTTILQPAVPGEMPSVVATVARRWSDAPFGVDVAADGTVYLLLEAASHPTQVWRFESFDAPPNPLADLNPHLTDIEMGTARLIEWSALDGERRRGTLLVPPGYVDGQRIPIVLDIYGGAQRAQFIHKFGGDEGILPGPLLTAHGIGVLYPDLPMTDRDPMRQLPGLTLPSVDRLIELGIADPERIGVMGHSYGGYCVLSLMTQTTRFRAAIAAAGFANLTSMYGALSVNGESSWLGWAETGQGRMGGSLWERRDAYIENSPLFYFDRATTPLLLVSGTANPDEAMQAGEAFSALRRLGKKVELRLYEGEDHWPGFWTEASYRDLCTHVVGWFREYLCG